MPDLSRGEPGSDSGREIFISCEPKKSGPMSSSNALGYAVIEISGVNGKTAEYTNSF